MRFLFHLFNHGKLGKSSLEDVIAIVGHQLKALGHEAIWDPKNDIINGTANIQFLTNGGGYNVIVEGFTGPTTQVLAQAHAIGARFICLATEEPTDKGFNHGTSKEMTQRQVDFAEAAKYFDGILHLVPGEHVTKWYGQFAPTAYTELGYAPTLDRTRFGLREPKFDFGFFGSLSKRRLSILKRLAKRVGKATAIRIVADFPSQAARDEAMRDVKIVLQIRKFDEMGLVSTSRCNTSLCLGRPVIAEPHDLSKPWDEVVKFTKTEAEFFDMALASRGAWRQIHADQFSKFKQKFPPEVCIGAPLRSLGLRA